MSEATKIVDRVLERIHYIHLPKVLTAADLVFIEAQLNSWKSLDVEIHVIDMAGLPQAHHRFFVAMKNFSDMIQPRRLVSLNMTDSVYKEVVNRNLETTFNRILQFPDDLYAKKKLGDDELKRTLIRYMIRAAYSAVEVALRSTVSCDENYLAKAESVPYSQFDMMAVVDVKNDFLKAQFRLCASAEVLRKCARAMLGPDASIDQEVIDSMASELLNLIYGQAKSHLNDRESFRLPPVIPKVIGKKQFSEIRRSSSPQQLSILPLVTPLGSFYVEIDTGSLV